MGSFTHTLAIRIVEKSDTLSQSHPLRPDSLSRKTRSAASGSTNRSGEGMHMKGALSALVQVWQVNANPIRVPFRTNQRHAADPRPLTSRGQEPVAIWQAGGSRENVTHDGTDRGSI